MLHELADLSNTTWQLGTTYALGGGVSLFGGYNTGYDLEWVIGARTADGTPFKPETSDQAEVGVRLTRDTLRASLSAFSIRRNDVAVPDPLNLGFQIQDGQFRVQGVEVEGEWSPTPGWWLQGGYAYLDGTVSRTTNPALMGARLADTPSTARPRRLADAGAASIARRRELCQRAQADERRCGHAPRLRDGRPRRWRSDGRWRFDATLNNVFDNLLSPGHLFVYSIGTEDRVLPGDPRTFSVRVSYSFGGALR